MAASKIQKENGVDPTPFEIEVAQALSDLEANSADLKAELRELFIVAAKEVDVQGRKAVVIFVPFRLLKLTHKIQSRLVRELEKKFSGRHVVLIAQRRIQRKETKAGRTLAQKRPRSRTLTAVHDAILEDLVYPTEIVGKHTRYKTDGAKLLKIYLNPKEAANVEYKLETFGTVYKQLTGKDVAFEFPVTTIECARGATWQPGAGCEQSRAAAALVGRQQLQRARSNDNELRELRWLVTAHRSDTATPTVGRCLEQDSEMTAADYS
eukprot:CAMPEP_0119414762 /NCGR_PEP_ID=MMETSP1335-20130426/7162_1 /TAXON_ID=259385 /ORGANISM="Chrysoculter rhomboideus, Strain RCC1486" /LENGTH=265 /DNA_ID=CAMNT_0007439651 /DNA_START=48 /DNA_END=843 /DNA_ORIENTATION=-